MAISAPARDRIGLGAFLAVFGFLLVGKLAILIGPHRPAPHAVWIRPLGAVGYPVVRGFVDQGTAEALPLRLGDSLVAVGDRDLSGAGMLRFAAAMQDVAWHTAGPVPITVGRAGARVTVALDRPAALPTSYLTSLVTMIAYALAAIVIFLRARPTPGARRMVSGLAWYSLFYGVVWDGPGWAYLATVAIALPVGLATPVALTRAFLSFPEEAGTYGPAHRWWPFVLSPLGPALMSAIYGFPAEPPIGTAAIPVIVVVWIFALLGALAVNYRRSGPVGRRRVKWVVYAAYLGGFINLIVIPAQGGFDNPLAQQAPMWTRLALTGTSLLFPGALLIAMLKFDLFDIDRILGATVGYNMLGVVVVGGGFIAVPPLTSAMASTLDINPSVSRTTITLVLAMAVIFAERRVRPYVDRAFFKERFALEQAMK
nr:hypothetical protein [Gemmatimonadaceae bacterium]